MAKITYMPTPEDKDDVVVDGITFTAYEPVDVPDEKSELIQKLDRNPWFTKGAVDADRQTSWEKVRGAQEAAQQHRAVAERLENDPHAVIAEQQVVVDQMIAAANEQATSIITAAHDQATTILSDAKTQAGMIVDGAKLEAADIVAKAKADAPPTQAELHARQAAVDAAAKAAADAAKDDPAPAADPSKPTLN